MTIDLASVYRTPAERVERRQRREFTLRREWRWALWDTSLSSTRKLVGLAMLERSNEHGEFSDPVRLLLEMTGLTSRQTIRNCWADLQAAGLIELAEAGDGEPNVWVLRLVRANG
jgi:hypothetical protein